MHPARSMPLRSGEKIATLGQGTWHFAERPARWAEEVASIRLGVDFGMTVIDTAEMYGNGAAEALVGEAIAGRRSEVFLVDKVLPRHAIRVGTVRACEASLGRLGGHVPGGDEAQTNQIRYNLTRRGPEYALLSWLAQHGIPTMAYSPIGQGRLLDPPALQPIALRHNATPEQIALTTQAPPSCDGGVPASNVSEMA
jgi:diketogulonate reductase-like aldo/keto reductase